MKLPIIADNPRIFLDLSIFSKFLNMSNVNTCGSFQAGRTSLSSFSCRISKHIMFSPENLCHTVDHMRQDTNTFLLFIKGCSQINSFLLQSLFFPIVSLKLLKWHNTNVKNLPEMLPALFLTVYHNWSIYYAWGKKSEERFPVITGLRAKATW